MFPIWDREPASIFDITLRRATVGDGLLEAVHEAGLIDDEGLQRARAALREVTSGEKLDDKSVVVQGEKPHRTLVGRLACRLRQWREWRWCRALLRGGDTQLRDGDTET